MHPSMPQVFTAYPATNAMGNILQQQQQQQHRSQLLSYQLVQQQQQYQQQQQQQQQQQSLQMMQMLQLQQVNNLSGLTDISRPITPTKFNIALPYHHHHQQQQQQQQLHHHHQQQHQQQQHQQQQQQQQQSNSSNYDQLLQQSLNVASNPPYTLLPATFTALGNSVSGPRPSNTCMNAGANDGTGAAMAAVTSNCLESVIPMSMSMGAATGILMGQYHHHLHPSANVTNCLIQSHQDPLLTANILGIQHPSDGATTIGLLGNTTGATLPFISSMAIQPILNNNNNNNNDCFTQQLTPNECSSASSDCSMLSPTLSYLTSPQKRGSDELLSQSTVMAPASDNNNQDLATKKAKLETGTVLSGIGKPSKVIHLRNIPNDSGDADVIALGIPFGRVTNVLVLKGKNQAFLEMTDEIAATSMVSCYTINPPQMRGRMVYVQFSNHRELKTDQNHGNSGQSDYRIQSPVSGSPLPLCGVSTNSTSNAIQSSIAETSSTVAVYNNSSNNTSNNPGGPNTVLRVIVESQLYPVSLDVLHQIFQRFGKVLKIVTFTKNNTFQALIQYPDAHSAQHAKTILDGQNIYNGCCTLRIDNSKMTTLNVKYNNDKSRDFTNPSLPPGEPGADIMPTAGGLVNANDLLLLAARQRPSITGDKIVNGMGAPGVLPPFALGIGAPISSGYNSGITNLGAFALANSGALQTPTPAMRGFSNVLLVSNLNEEMVTPDALFTLFGVYGDVQRVKILYNKKDSALIQMAEPQQAYLAMNHLDKIRLWGKPIRVMASKHQAVQLPKEGQPDAGLTRDYSQNPLHRFKKPGSKNYQNIYPPSATLHLSNIPSSCTEEDIKEAFASNNFEVKAFKFFPKDRKMALLQLSSVEEAVLALIKMHNHQLSESNHLRVSFSKSNI